MGSDKLFVQTRTNHSSRLLFWHVFSKVSCLQTSCLQDSVWMILPQMGSKSFGTFKKRTSGLEIICLLLYRSCYCRTCIFAQGKLRSCAVTKLPVADIFIFYLVLQRRNGHCLGTRCNRSIYQLPYIVASNLSGICFLRVTWPWNLNQTEYSSSLSHDCVVHHMPKLRTIPLTFLCLQWGVVFKHVSKSCCSYTGKNGIVSALLLAKRFFFLTCNCISL